MLTRYRGGVRTLCRPKDLENKTPMQILTHAGINTAVLPIDMNAVLKSLKIIAAPTDFKPLEEAKGDELRRLGNIMGMVGIRKDNVVMVYAQNLDISQQRYVVAHELGHACNHTSILKEGHILARYTGILDTEREKVADAFASELLLPEVGLEALFGECLDVFNLSGASDDVLRENRRQILTYISDKSQVPYYVVEDRLLKLKPHMANCLTCAEEASSS